MKKLVFIIASVLVIGFTNQTNAQNKDIVDIAVSVDDFSTLVTALKTADLVGALKGEGPFTVFAPTNAAFGKIDSKTLGSLLEPAGREALTSILTYHVISGKIAASDVVAALEKGNGKVELKTLNGAPIQVMSKDGKIYLKDQYGNYSQIVKTDVMGSNGVIHIIDTVVMPK
ncbi:MAG: fasciclin domain-containing protein [Bacteroidia bacterium]|nr:fasciclin domain-containing protein [Bacteroidia bacterium]MBT8267978.1 fasciclin domain-containing protein [Bacteroidia bacterium]NNF82567.1 fasciclin domain-containing protein [Flavobacteriaceae bacterium]NNK70271.1 fasciclin domain-containing protein [Flavobacteriaceae bacterium]NNL79301.1 fasciclin domain-containing protein [Flavobacteriaceae bacterium]